MSDEDWDEDWDEDGDEDRYWDDVEPTRAEDAWYRDRIDVAFAKLEERGYLARACHLCCAGCAGSDLANQAEAMPPRARGLILGAVFYHEQDAESIPEGQVAVRFCGGADDSDKVMVEVGKLACDSLRRQGLTVEWSGKANEVILAKAAAL